MSSSTVADEQLVNLLKEWQNSRTLSWTMHRVSERTPVRHITDQSPRSYEQIVIDTLAGKAMKQLIVETAEQRGWAAEEVEQEISSILRDEMAHKIDLKFARPFALVVRPAFSRLFASGIFTNAHSVLAGPIRDACLHGTKPVVFLPSHRSYIDFLLISLLCFQYDVPLPAIASAMDFKGMAGVSTLLQRSGAFFIRRGGSSREQTERDLYSNILSTYVQEHVSGRDRPVEFFIEGTRSRTGKSLHPKLGMLAMIIEPYLRGEVSDVLLVPISISYEQTLEERLYAYELLGTPKPRESTSALFRALSVLQTDHGPIHCVFSQPVSLRDCLAIDKLKQARELIRTLHLHDADLNAVKSLAVEIIGRQQRSMHVSLWPLLCACLIHRYDSWIGANGLIVDKSFLETVLNFRNLYIVLAGIRDDKFNIVQPDQITVNEIRKCFERRDYIFKLMPHADDISVAFILPNNSSGSEHMETAVQWLILSYYNNRFAHAFALPACALLAQSTSHKTQPSNEFQLLCQLFHREFAWLTHCDPNTALSSQLALLKRCGKPAELILKYIQPWLTAYQVVLTAIQSMEKFKEAQLIGEVRAVCLTTDQIHRCLPLAASSDLVRNALHSFVSLGIVHKDRLDNGSMSYVLALKSEASMLVHKLSTWTHVCDRSEFPSEILQPVSKL